MDQLNMPNKEAEFKAYYQNVRLSTKRIRVFAYYILH